DKRFCGSCGGPVGSSGSGPLAAAAGDPPKHLAGQILAERRALAGGRKQGPVRFAGLRASLGLLSEPEPGGTRAVPGTALERMMEAVHRYEGTVTQVMGDGIRALFGAPLAHEDHAVRASYAALRIQDTVRRYAEEVRSRHGIPLHVRVGLNSGEVVVRS